MKINLVEHKPNEHATHWDLPMWGHPLSSMIMPLFMLVDGCLHPVGTAFRVSGKISFLFTADHNLREAIKKEPRLERLFVNGQLPNKASLVEVSLYVLHCHMDTSEHNSFTLIPLEHTTSAPPTDITIASPQFVENLASLSLPISFEIPARNSKVWSIGYTFPPNMLIPLEEVKNGVFDWETQYNHCFQVVEAYVLDVFCHKFASGFIEGPCFTFNQEISHGLSGGPVISEQGVVIGVNSAGASNFYPEMPASIASLLYPIILNSITCRLQIGPVGLNVTRPIIDLIAQGSIKTDGSETSLSFTQDTQTDQWAIGARYLKSADNVFENFSSLQNGVRPELLQQPFYVLNTENEAP